MRDAGVCVADPGVTMEVPSITVALPNLSNKEHIMALEPRRVSKDSHDSIVAQIDQRAMLDYWQYEGLDAAGAAVAYEEEMKGDDSEEEMESSEEEVDSSEEESDSSDE